MCTNHASFSYVPRYPPLPQLHDSSFIDGVTISIREKNNKPVSLFISPRGEFVAVTSGTTFLLSLYVKLLTKHCLKTKATVNQALPEQVADGSSRLTNT
ncbi:unnamed protein product, partial [Brassica oleracea]